MAGASVVQGALVSCLFWHLAGADYSTPKAMAFENTLYVAWKVLVFSWPIWIFILLKCRGTRNGWKIIVPLFFGFLAMLPGLLPWVLLSNFTGCHT